MRSMKRAGALTLAALILAFSLTACGKDGGSSGSGASSSAAGSTSSSEPITVDLDAVTDVFLTTAGIPGDTVVAQVGDVDITAAELLYWVAYSADSMLSYYSTYFGITELPWDTEDASGVTLTQGTLDNALRTAALYALIPGIAEEEGVTLSQDFQDTFADQLATMTEAMGGEDVMAMYLWQYPLTPELYTQLCESEDLNGQLQDKYFGENGTMKPTDADRGKGAHGGGAFSGKDPSKVDRSAAYAARHIAKNMVAAGVADEMLVQISYAIGVARPVNIYVNTYGRSHVSLSDGEIAQKIDALFDLRPKAIEDRLKLRNPIYEETAAYGHMGRQPQTVIKEFHSRYMPTKTLEVELFTWEKLDYVAQIKEAFGL